jgi:hypothetical protein
MSPSSRLVTDNHLIQVNNALDNIRLAQNEIDLAKRAGIDVTAQQKQLDDSKSKLLQFKQVYFPGR